jgi:hypothetical protein
LNISDFPDSESYWGSYLKYKKSCLNGLWNLDAGAAAKKLPLVAPQEYLLLSGVYAGVFF